MKDEKNGMVKINIGDLVIYNNNQLIAFNKPAGIPVQPDKTNDKSLLELGEIYCKHGLFLIHRIDRPASGIVLFAKNKKALANINQQFVNQKVDKSYLLISSAKLKEEQGIFKDQLEKNAKLNKSFVVDKKSKESKEAILHYKYVEKSERYFLYQVKIETGRHHQIRAQFSHRKAFIKGDVKYGFRRGNKDRSIDLLSWKMQFAHPVQGELVQLEVPLPKEGAWAFFMQ